MQHPRTHFMHRIPLQKELSRDIPYRLRVRCTKEMHPYIQVFTFKFFLSQKSSMYSYKLEQSISVLLQSSRPLSTLQDTLTLPGMFSLTAMHFDHNTEFRNSIKSYVCLVARGLVVAHRSVCVSVCVLFLAHIHFNIHFNAPPTPPLQYMRTISTSLIAVRQQACRPVFHYGPICQHFGETVETTSCSTSGLSVLTHSSI